MLASVITLHLSCPFVTITIAGNSKTPRHYFGDIPSQACFIRRNVLAGR
jgi:hypothetical protein